jgi:hypothetical protein
MRFFRRKARDTGQDPAPVPASPDKTHQVLRDAAGKVEGLWLATKEQAHAARLEALLTAEGLHDSLLAPGYRIIANTFTDHGGVFVRFVEPVQELDVGDRAYPIREDFETFSRDAVTGSIALLRTTIAALTMDDVGRLHAVLSAALGEDAPQTRAVVDAPFQCLTCFRLYPARLIFLRDHVRAGGGIGGTFSAPEGAEMEIRHVTDFLPMTACLDCGGTEAVWIYDPSRQPE